MTLLTQAQVTEIQDARVQAILDLEQALTSMDTEMDIEPLEQRLTKLKEERKYQWFSYRNGGDYLEETDLREVKVTHLWNILHMAITRRMGEKFEVVLEQVCLRGVCAKKVPVSLYVTVVHKKDAALAWRFSKLQQVEYLDVYKFFISLYMHQHDMPEDKFNTYFNSMKELIINFGV